MIADWKQKLKPGLPKQWLYFLAGAMWAGVGILLNSYVYQWVKELKWNVAIFSLLGGLILAFLIYRFGFSKLADKNISRVQDLQSKNPCVFAFQQWTSYPLVAVMITMGIYLRKYSPFPKSLLAVLYVGIGVSLFTASIHYFRTIFIKIKE